MKYVFRSYLGGVCLIDEVYLDMEWAEIRFIFVIEK